MTTHAFVLRHHPWMGLAEVDARVPRANEHGVVPDPLPDDDSHAVLVPSAALTGGKRKEAARRIAKAARIVVAIPKLN